MLRGERADVTDFFLMTLMDTSVVKHNMLITQIIENKISIKSLFYFAEEGPGHGSEDIKKECNVNCFDFFVLFCLFDGSHGWKKSQST